MMNTVVKHYHYHMLLLSSRKLASMEAVLPVHPDIQKMILKEHADQEQLKTVRSEDWERINYYLTQV